MSKLRNQVIQKYIIGYRRMIWGVRNKDNLKLKFWENENYVCQNKISIFEKRLNLEIYSKII